MKALISKLLPRKKTVWCCAAAKALFIVLSAGIALGDEIDDSLPANTPEQVKASTRQAIKIGLEQARVIKLTRAMLQNRFDEHQIQLAHALMIEARNSGLPVQPLMNKAFEGMAKNAPSAMIVGAMEKVQSRHAFAHQKAARLTDQKNSKENLRGVMAAGLAAGLTKEDADKIIDSVEQHARTKNTEQVYSLALESFITARDVSRLSISSQAVSNMVTQALNKGFSAEDMRVMRSSFMTEARHSKPQELVHRYSSAILQGKGFQKGAGSAGGQKGGAGSGGAGGGAGQGGSGGSGPGGGSGSGGSGPGGGDGSGGSGGSGPGGGGGSGGPGGNR